MSSRRSNANTKKHSSKVAPAPQPYCAHCFNLGKDESVFRSHWLRASPDPSSPVVCPELLATECSYCFKQGHTKSRCPIILAQEKAAKKEEWRLKLQAEAEEKAKKEVKAPKVKGVSKFAALMEDSDSEDEKPVMKVSKNINVTKKIEEFPALPSSKKVAPTAPQANSYAAMTAKSKSAYEDDQYLKSKLVKAVVPPMPKLVREQVVDIPLNSDDIWDGFDPENDDEVEYMIQKIEDEMEYNKIKIEQKYASNLTLAQWCATNDSDDEDW